MNKILSDLANNPSMANTPLGREAQDDANDAQNRVAGTYPNLDACDSTAKTRLALAAPVGLASGGLFLVLAWTVRRARQAIIERRARPSVPALALCPACGSLLGVDSICAQCSAFRAGASEQWWDRLPEEPPTRATSHDNGPST